MDLRGGGWGCEEVSLTEKTECVRHESEWAFQELTEVSYSWNTISKERKRQEVRMEKSVSFRGHKVSSSFAFPSTWHTGDTHQYAGRNEL